MSAALGVGLLGAGPVVQSIHVPVLQRLSDHFAVRRVMDVDPGLAATVASRVGARPTTSAEELLADPSIDVVAICSPAGLHAEQVIAAIDAGKKAVLCEKPLATTRAAAEAIAAAGAQAGVPVFVGAMHTVDPSWTAAQRSWGDLTARVHTVRSRIVLPPNTRFEDWSTQLLSRPTGRPLDMTDPQVRGSVFAEAIFGLAIHNLPLVRAFLPEAAAVRVEHAQLLDPWGYLAVLSAGGRIAQVTGAVTGRWEPQWTLEAIADHRELHLAFPPSFVHAGSGVATLTQGQTSSVFGPFTRDGYLLEWEHVAAAAAGDLEVVPTLQDLVDDLVFAVDVAEQGARLVATEE